MKNKRGFLKLQEFIVRDQKLLCTVTSFVMILAIYANQSINPSPIIGTMATIVYFLINATFLGQAFFEGASPFLRFMAGSLTLIVSLGLIAWAIMVIYSLDIVGSAATLIVVTTLCSFSNKMVKTKDATQ